MFQVYRKVIQLYIHSEVSQRQISYNIIYMWNLKKMIQMNLFTKQKQTHKENKLMVTKGEGGSDKLGVCN